MDNAKWLRKTFEENNIIDCTLHMDEKTPHIHAMIIPCDTRGKLNARHFIGGTRVKMSELQSDYAEAMRVHGLERGICRELSKSRHESSLRWHQRQAEKEARLYAYEKKYGTENDWDFDTVIEFRRIKKGNECNNSFTNAKENIDKLK